MKNFATLAALVVGANALVSRDNACCFHLSASGGASGPIGQLDDGQNRVYGDLPEGEYCINADGGIIDAQGRGCILTPPTSQFQCDSGVPPTNGFSINAQGELTYNGKTDFVACATGQNGGMNLYTTESDAVTRCTDIKLNADTCANSGAGSSLGSSSSVVYSSDVSVTPSSSIDQQSTPAATSTSEASTTTASSTFEPSTPAASSTSEASVPAPESSTLTSTMIVKTTITITYCPETTAAISSAQPSSAPSETSQPSTAPSSDSGSGSQTESPSGTQPSATQPASGSCPTDLSGQYEFPHLIIPVDSSSPSKAPGTSYNGTVSSTVSSFFNFDIPSSDAGKTCSLVFLFPKLEDLETSSYTFSGDGKVNFAMMESAVTSQTSYSNAPAVKEDYGVTTISPGNSYLIATFQCPAGEAIGFEMKNAGSTYLDFFEDYNPSPLGLYITVC